MQYAEPDMTWVEWAGDDPDRSHGSVTELLALHEYIVRTARDQVDRGEITAEWANKKLAVLGITDRLPTGRVPYGLEAPVSGTLSAIVYAGSRTEAAEKFREMLAVPRLQTVIDDPTVQGDPVFTSGPEDVDPDVVDPDAPTTVAATLAKLREVILLGNVSGPRWNCDSGANRVLAEYGLAPVPSRKTFTITRRVEADMVTTVEAYDEESAGIVAGWRWENDHVGYSATNPFPTGGPHIAAN